MQLNFKADNSGQIRAQVDSSKMSFLFEFKWDGYIVTGEFNRL